MKVFLWIRFAFALCLLATCMRSAHGQGLTGSISGIVQDSSGAAIAGAEVTLMNAGTEQKRSVKTDDNGSFLVTDLLPGNYLVGISATGFRRHKVKSIELSANERVTLRAITLELGDVAESVSVTAENARLQTQSSERSGLITTRQLQEIPLKGRDYLGMVKLLPGVVDTANREAPGFNSLHGININGNRRATINLTMDGVSNLDTGNLGGPFISPSLDAISEMKVLLTNYQAEYGRSSGGTINVIVKNGTRDFHGSGYYFIRNEAFNANEFFNNRDGQPKPNYRYNNAGYTIGGPVIIPKLMTQRDKLFFFWSQEFLPRSEPQGQIRRTVPTALERQGDFSQTFDTNGRLIQILDPANNRRPFPGNVIPADRIDAGGQALLNVFPLPNIDNPLNTYNYVYQNVVDHPWRQELLRVDYNISAKDLFYVRLIQTPEAFKSPMDTNLGARDWPQFNTVYNLMGRGAVATLIHTFSSSLVNETTVGVNRGTQTIRPADAAALAQNSRATFASALPQLYPQNNPLQIIPNATFGGVSNAPALNIEARFPFSGTNNIWNFSDNLTKLAGRHNLKAGVYIENTARNGNRVGTPFGQFDFGRNVNNPNDANYAFANALLGSVNSYSESDTRPYSQVRYQNYEWFLQDNWRATTRLTLDLGVRFYRIIPSYLEDSQVSTFAPELFRASDAPLLIEPALSGATRVGRNPLTGETVPAVLIGTIVPGTGNLLNGIRLGSDGRIFDTPPIQVAPRVGFAFDVFGTGKTVIRGGAGIFPDRMTDTTVGQLVQQPPLTNTFTAYYTTIPQLLTVPLVTSPQSIVGVERNFNPPASYNWSFGVQQDIGFSTVLDVAYVGNVGRHLQQVRNLNATPYGTNFLPSSIDPTTNRALPTNFLRPMRGFATVNYTEFAANSNYNSMQVQVNRRFSQRFTYGASWTWSKAMNTADNEGSSVNPFFNPRIREYGKATFDRTHNVAISYVYDVPNLSSRFHNLAAKILGDGWQISGVTSFISGAPLGISYSFVTATDITGGGVDSRVNLVGNPTLPRGERTPRRAFRTEVVRPPDASNFGIGNAPKDVFRGPGVNNWDVSLYRNISMGEGRNLQLRFESYNLFNHTQFSGVNTSARFDASGNQVNADFGAYTAARPSRRLQLGIKFTF
ncbi:MAG: TonB-dependent receptor [Acidobacteriales bacterium]|nr:TonB-dependent receptor [Terriglobales bacterium]